MSKGILHVIVSPDVLEKVFEGCNEQVGLLSSIALLLDSCNEYDSKFPMVVDNGGNKRLAVSIVVKIPEGMVGK